jgi:hypothetical protein
MIEQAVDWIEGGKAFLHKREDARLYAYAKKLGPENFGILYFIEELYSNWFAREDMD